MENRNQHLGISRYSHFSNTFNSNRNESLDLTRDKKKIRTSFKMRQNISQKQQIQIQRTKYLECINQKRKNKNKAVEERLKRKIKQINLSIKENQMRKKINNNDANTYQIFNTQKKNQYIQRKIYERREKVEQIRAQYTQKLGEKINLDSQKCKKRLQQIQKQRLEKMLSFHLSQWRQHQKKLHQANKKQMKRNFHNSLDQLYPQQKQNIRKYEKNIRITHKKEPTFNKINCIRNISKTPEKHQDKSFHIYKHVKQTIEFGINSQIKCPQNLLIKLKKFLTCNRNKLDLDEDKQLLYTFEDYLISI